MINGATPADHVQRASAGARPDRVARFGHHPVVARLRALGAEVTLRGEDLSAHLTTGKLLRARLVLLAAAASGAPRTARALDFAVAVELIHAGALCHDDVVDGSATRRGRPSVVHRFGPRAAVLAGSALMVRAAELLADEAPGVRRVVARALRDVARGQTDEVLDAFDPEQSPDAYRRRTYAKTGALYELAARLGALAGGLPALGVEALAAYGAEMGIAFQLSDDLRDLLGGPDLGREAGTDLRQGVYTLPVLLTLAGRCPGGARLRGLLPVEGPEGLARAVALLCENGALEATAVEAAAHVMRARDALQLLPRSRARTRLAQFARRFLPPPVSIGAAGRTPPSETPMVGDAPRTWVRGFATELAMRLAATPERLRPPLGRFWAHVGHRADGVPWVEDVARATGVGSLLLAFGTAVEAEPRSSSTAATVGLVDLLVGDLFCLLSGLPSRAAGRLGSCLAVALREAAARAAASRCGEPGPADDLAALADAAGRATAEALAGGANG